MATFTTAQMAAAGVPAAATSSAGMPGPIVIDYYLDASKKTIAATDIVTLFDIPTYSAFIVDAANITVIKGGTASATIDLGIAGTDTTGLTAFDAATVASSTKLATGANTVATTSGASSLTAQVNTAGLGSGIFRIRVFGTLVTA